MVALSLALLFVTPYNRGTVLNWAHMAVGVLGALAQLGISLRLVSRRPLARVAAEFVVQLAGGLVAATSLPNANCPHLLLGEIVYEVGFAWCLLEWTFALEQ